MRRRSTTPPKELKTMAKPLFDEEALINALQHATAKHSAQVREAVHAATLQALQAREMTMKNVRSSLKAVVQAASAGAARNLQPGIDAEALLDKAVSGMDDALLKAVQAHRAALRQLAAQGADLRDKHLRKALNDLEHFEDAVVAAIKKAANGASAPLGEAWHQVLQRMQQAGGSAAGAQAAATVEQMVDQVHSAVRSSRAAGMRAAQALAESYSAMVSGVLIGMSQALEQSAAAAKGPASAPGTAQGTSTARTARKTR
jgi:hypothetical protein